MPQKIKTGYRPHRYQADIHRNLRRFSVLVCHRRFGKTVLAVNSLIDAALRHVGHDNGAPARYGYIAPYRTQAKTIAWDYLKRYALPVPQTVASETELAVRFPNNAIIRLFGADNADAMRGLYFDGVVLDEVADMKPHVWGMVVRPALADRQGWALFIGTPKGSNLFEELYHCGLKDPEWYTAVFPANETGLIAADELAQAQATMTSLQYRQEFLCDFAASAEDVLIPLDLVTQAMGQMCPVPRGAALVLGVDVARFGNDASVLIYRQGGHVWPPQVFQDVDNMALAGHVAHTLAQRHPDAVFVDGGRGEGVIDRLRSLGYAATEVNFAGRAQNPRYANKRAEMWDGVRAWLQAGGTLPQNRTLAEDLSRPRFGFDAQGRLQLESKKDLKKRFGRSTDMADALALTFAYPAHPKQGALHAAIQAKTDYNPLV